MDPTPTETLLHEQPAHIILFRRVDAGNAELLASILDVSPLPEPSTRATRTVLGTANGVHARVYRSLGVTVATLTPGEITRLRALDEVVAMLPNEERHLPGDTQAEVRPGIQIEPGAQDGHGHGTYYAEVVADRAQPAGGRRYGMAPEVTVDAAPTTRSSTPSPGRPTRGPRSYP